MAKRSILTLILEVLSLPFVALSRSVEFLNLWKVSEDVGRCVDVIDSQVDILPKRFITALIAAEDHRSPLHRGIDPIAMIRAGLVRFRHKQIEGASTIEQQLVRTVTGRYERSLLRKIREQAIAIAVARRRSKRQTAAAYLAVAYYGSECVGLAGLKKCCGGELECADPRAVLSAIARLKYPQPLHPTKRWRQKIDRRIQYIVERLPDAANSALERTGQCAAPPARAPAAQLGRWAS